MDARALIARLRRHLTGRGPWWWVPLMYIAALAWIYRDLWWQDGRATAFGWDVPAAYGPNLEYLGRDLADGQLSWWNPYDKGGYAVVGDPECDRYNPLAALFIGISALTGGAWWLIHVKVLAYHLVAALCLHAYLRGRGLGHGGALVGGLALIASTPVLVHKASAVMWPLIWVPLAWLAIDRALAAPSWRRGALVGAALGLVVTAGSPPGWFYAALLIGPYGGWRLVAAMRAGGVDGRRLARAGLAATAVLAPLVLVVVVPLLDAIALSTRAGVDGGAFALDGSQAPAQVLPALLVPTAGKLEAYVGGVVLALGLAGLVVRPRADGGAPVWWCVTAAVGLVLVFGRTTPVLPLLVDWVPGFGRLRVPGRYKLVTAWAAAPLAALGLASLLAARDELRARRRVSIVLAALAALAVVLVLVVPQVPLPPHPRAKALGLVPVVLGAAAVVALLRAPARRLGLVVAAIAAVIVVDAPSFLHTPQSPPIADPQRPHDGEVELLAGLGDVSVRLPHLRRVRARRAGRHAPRSPLPRLPSVDQLSQRRYVDVLERAHRAGDPHRRQRALAPARAALPQRLGHQLRAARAPTATGASSPAPQPLPGRAPGTAGGVVRRGAGGVASRGAHRSAGSRARRRAPLRRRRARSRRGWRQPSSPPPRPSSVAGEIVGYGADRIVARVEAPAAGVVVLNELWDPSWRAWVDGRAAPVVRINLLRGVRCRPARTGSVAVRAAGDGHALLGGALAWLAALIALALELRRRT
ncbi:MAG: hypothetical protein R2939_05710 [Kofleriaceae bacterium]